MQLITIATGIAYVATAVFDSALPEAQSRELVKGYRTESMQFSGLISGIEYSANGTFQKIIAQFKKDHPVTAAPSRLSKSASRRFMKLMLRWRRGTRLASIAAES
ncbi:hypothetical protein B0J14DRAFT_557687 [Halenospora varia]|nr:hypothetical protein B0J14DRAFT_557687 [Halenospora varia]